MVLTLAFIAIVASVLLFYLAQVADRRVIEPSLLSPATLTTGFFILAYLWRPLLYLIDASKATTFPDYGTKFDSTSILFLMVACTFGIAVFNLGFAFSGGKKIAEVLPPLEWRNPWYITALIVLFCVIAFFVVRRVLSGANFFQMMALNFGTARNFYNENVVGNGPLLFFVNNLYNWFLMALILFAATKGAKFSGRKFLPFLAAAIFAFGAIAYVILLQRAPLITMVLYLVLCTHFYFRRVSLSVQILLLGGLLLLGGVIGLFMLGRLANSTNGGLGGLAMAMTWRVSGSLDQFEDLYRAVKTTTNFRLGTPFFQDVVLTYIPRALWSAKPELYGAVLLQNDLMPSLFEGVGLHATFPVGFFAECYMNFGWAGFAIGPFIYGVTLRVLTECGLNPKSGYSLLWMQPLASNIGIVRSLSSYFVLFGFPLIFFFIFYRPIWRRRMDTRPNTSIGATSVLS